MATNLDITVQALPSCTRRTKNTRVLRLPDQPSHADIRSIGYGQANTNCASSARSNYDEDKFGALVLDECGTWLNSRDWQEDGRRELISYFLHIRKMLWDVYLIIQDISMLDKQVRKALAEHVVYCRRLDKVGIPLVTKLTAMMGHKISGPKMHLAIVKYGDQQHSLTVDRWWFRGTDLYDAYDTTQTFDEHYPHGVFSLVPPAGIFSASFTKWDFFKVMRLTRIILRKWSLALLLASGAVLGSSKV